MSEIEVSDLADIARLILALFPEEINEVHEGEKHSPLGPQHFYLQTNITCDLETQDHGSL